MDKTSKGRPTKFNSSFTAKVAALYAVGKTDAEVAKAIGVSLRTIYYWKSSHPDFLHALKEGKSLPDDLVEASLFRRATGYSHPEEKIFVYEGRVIRVKTEKHYPPDVTAQIFWLKNRRPDEWREKDTPPIPPEPEMSASTLNIANGIMTFSEFCLKAGYFQPFPKQEEMRSFGMDIQETRLLLGSRGYGKTDFVTIMGVAYDLYVAYKSGNDMSEHTNLIITKSKNRCTAIIEEISNALEKAGVDLDKSNSEVIRVAGLIGQDHSVEAITIKTSMRGRHPKRIVMDDPVTDEDVSDAMRRTVKRRYDEAYKLCSNILIIGQPAHFDDLYAQLRGVIKTLEVPHGTIPELDADLEAMRIAGVDPHSIEMSYHLKVPTNDLMPFSKIKYIDKFPTGGGVAFIDPSEGGDYTALSCLKGFMDGVAVQGYAWKKAWYHCLDDIVPILISLGITRLCFETNKFGKQPIEQLSILLAPHGIGVVGRHSDSDKHSAIMSAGSYSHMIHLSRESNKAYTDQVIKYEYNAEFDDSPDSLARCLEWIGLLRGKK